MDFGLLFLDVMMASSFRFGIVGCVVASLVVGCAMGATSTTGAITGRTAPQPSKRGSMPMTPHAETDREAIRLEMAKPSKLSSRKLGHMQCPATTPAAARPQHTTYTPPIPKGVFVPPLPTPIDERGNKILLLFFVTSMGANVGDSVTVCGLNGDYGNKLMQVARNVSSKPATRNGIPESAVAQIIYTF